MDYFAAHGLLAGIFLLFSLAIFPRITMIFMLIFGTLTGGGFLWWLGFLLLPHIVVAVEATNHYWHTNPVLCVIAWLIAFGGSGIEISTARSRRD